MKVHNQYSRLINPKVYDRMPKTVLAAIVVSLLILKDGENSLENLTPAILDEWHHLHESEIVKQKPPKDTIK